MEEETSTLDALSAILNPDKAPAEEIPAEVEEATEEPTEETAEETEVPATPEEGTDVKVPLKALQEEKRKRQEYEAKLKEIEERLNAVPQPKQEQSLEDIYAADPQGTTSRINAEIARLQNDDPFQNAEQIERLRDLKIELREKVQVRQVTSEKQFVAELQREVPDLQAKSDEYTKFALEQLGYDRETLATLTNPSIVGGKAAIKFVKAVATQYARANATQTIKAKSVQAQPTKTETPGSGSPPSNNELAEAWKTAEATGNFTDYLVKAGLV